LIRAANSVPTNIVEGSGQEGQRDFCRFLRYSINSANEAEYHCLAAHDYGLIPQKKYAELTSMIAEVRKMLYGLLNYLKSREG
jgi:four helix bundle protein